MSWYRLAIMKQSWNWKEFFKGVALSALSLPFILILLNVSNQKYKQMLDDHHGDEAAVRKELEEKLQNEGVSQPERFERGNRPQAQRGDQIDMNRLTRNIARHEGSRNRAYNDTEGNRTVGVGFNMDRPSARQAIEAVGADFDAVYRGTQALTDAQIESLLQEDIATAIDDASGFLPNMQAHPAPVQEAVVNMAFNLGGPRLNQFNQTRRALQNFDYNAAANEMLDSRWARQVGNRANELADTVRSAVR